MKQLIYTNTGMLNLTAIIILSIANHTLNYPTPININYYLSFWYQMKEANPVGIRVGVSEIWQHAVRRAFYNKLCFLPHKHLFGIMKTKQNTSKQQMFCDSLPENWQFNFQDPVTPIM